MGKEDTPDYDGRGEENDPSMPVGSQGNSMGFEYAVPEWTDFLPDVHESLPVTLLLLAGFFGLRQDSQQQTAWELVAIAWFWTLYNVMYGILRADGISVSGMEDMSARAAIFAQIYQENVYLSLMSALTLPVVMAVLIVALLLLRCDSRPHGVMRWVYVSLALATFDTILFVVMVSSTAGTWGVL